MTVPDNDNAMVTPCDVALRLGHELDRLGMLADSLQIVIAGLGVQDHVTEAVQSLDLMTQSLFALSAFLEEWSLILDGTIATNIGGALTKIRLADIVRRLTDLGQTTADQAGAVEMFAEDV